MHDNGKAREDKCWFVHLLAGAVPIGTDTCKVSLYEEEDGDRGIVTLAPIEKSEIVMTIPTRVVLAVHPDHAESNRLVYKAAPYSVKLACKLLREKAEGVESAWCPYIEALPRHVECPILEFSGFDFSTVDYPDGREQLEAYSLLLADSWAKLSPRAHGGCSKEDYYWAMSIVHSRTFGTSGTSGPMGVHMLVPLVDMYNHGGDRCKGLFREDAEKLDSAEWRLRKTPNEEWELDVIATSPIEAHEPMLMSYGERSNDDFMIFYGFIPPLNPKDDYVLFSDLPAALEWYIQTFLADQETHIQWKWRKDALRKGEAEEESVPSGGGPSAIREHAKIRIMSGSFVDGRLLAAFEHLTAISEVSTTEAIKVRCLELLSNRQNGFLNDLKLLSQSMPDSEHEFVFLFQFYSRALKKFAQAGGKLPSSESSTTDLGAELSYSQKLIKTYLVYKAMILWDVLLDLNRLA